MRYLDHLMNTAEGRRIFEEIGGAGPIFKIDNVSRYMYEQEAKEHWEFSKDFPNCAPPFPVYWMETEAPRFINSEIHGRVNWEAWKRMGVLTEAHEVGTEAFSFPTAVGPRTYCDYQIRKIQWAINQIIFLDWPILKNNSPAYVPGCSDVVGNITYGVLENGEVAEIRPGEALLATQGSWAEFGVGMHTLLWPVLLATSFCHCKNVIRLENVPPKEVNAAHQKLYGRNLVRYYTLQIEPMKKVLRHEGMSLKQGIGKALHICRGHFKDFRTNGLFGKYQGIFWWDNQIRGSLSQGAIIKDYSIKSQRPS